MTPVNTINKLFSFDINSPISFTSGDFLLLFSVFIVVYAFLFKNRSVRTIYVIAFSLFFYYKLSGWFFLLLLLTTTIDFILAGLIHKTENKKKKLIFLIVSICASLGLLVYFKYTNFFLENFSSLTREKFTTLSIIVPLGISFYTFRTISYIIDVYREEIKPTKHYFDYVFYMTFFPLLIAGPITRAKQFLPHARKQEKVNKALFLIIQGLIKKAVIADYIGQYCNLVFDAPGTYSGFENLIAVYGFALQIYFDFSGYTDIAIGLAKLMGFDIGINFNKPYHSLNVTDFWRRWHISLSNWLRDYLFTPMILKFRNWGNAGIVLSLFLTFSICGLWHGANWTYILWGALFGAAMGFEILTAKFRKKIKKKTNKHIYNFISWFITFHFVSFLWIFFRSQDMQTAGTMINQIFTDFSLSYFTPFMNVRGLLIFIMLGGIILYAIPAKWFPDITRRFVSLPYWLKIIAFIVVVQLVIQFKTADMQPFLYALF
jgi:alginate O-acetyltransferase complex protein AlgI